MTRLRSGKLKIEHGRWPTAARCSKPRARASTTKPSMRAFEREVLKPLLALKVQPLERSKSAIGGDCAR